MPLRPSHASWKVAASRDQFRAEQACRRRRRDSRPVPCCSRSARRASARTLAMIVRSRTILTRIAVGLLLVVSCLAATPWLLGQRARAARRHWKDEAIPLVASWAEDKN
jgi:hypothetical protein